MILTGNEIRSALDRGEIIISPFRSDWINPNSYNYSLDGAILQMHDNLESYDLIYLQPSGFTLRPRTLYLACTAEIIGSRRYITTLLGRSSLGRLGLFLNVTADLGHVGCESQWTLELTVVQPLRVYPGMRIGQVAFWEQLGRAMPYGGRYHGDVGPRPNKDRTLAAASHLRTVNS
jgi:dCTP deaminase